MNWKDEYSEPVEESRWEPRGKSEVETYATSTEDEIKHRRHYSYSDVQVIYRCYNNKTLSGGRWVEYPFRIRRRLTGSSSEEPVPSSDMLVDFNFKKPVRPLYGPYFSFLEKCKCKSEYQFVYYKKHQEEIEQNLIVDKTVRSMRLQPVSISDREQVNLEGDLKECFSSGIKRITMRGGEVLVGYTDGAQREFAEDCALDLTIMGTDKPVRVFLHAIHKCETISSNLKAFLGIDIQVPFPVRTTDNLYDVFNENITFDDWIPIFADMIKQNRIQNDELLYTFFQLCSKEDLKRLESLVENFGDYDCAAMCYWMGEHYDRLRSFESWDEIKKEGLPIPDLSSYAFPCSVEPEDFLRACRIFRDILKIAGNHPEMTRNYIKMIYICERIRGIESKPGIDVVWLPNILVTGEAGTGKELFSKAFHALSGRPGQFQQINCSSYPQHLLEDELFGHVKGAFTDAWSDREGCITKCDQGTLQLDEIGKIPLEQQAKILRVLEEREYRRLGETKTRKANVLFVASTNQDLQKKVKEGEFAHDLYQRLSSETIHLPPLRDRLSDVPLLVRHFLQVSQEYSPHNLEKYRLPLAIWAYNKVQKENLNARELRNLIENLANRSVELLKVWRVSYNSYLPAEVLEKLPSGIREKLVRTHQIAQDKLKDNDKMMEKFQRALQAVTELVDKGEKLPFKNRELLAKKMKVSKSNFSGDWQPVTEILIEGEIFAARK